MNTLQQSIDKMTANGNRLELPQDVHFSNYAEVKKALIQEGGAYKGNGFDFPESGQAVKDRILSGSVNRKKQFQFFDTPEPIARRLIMQADLAPGMSVLEPSAGHGAILDVLPKVYELTAVELRPEAIGILKGKGYEPIEGDFMGMFEENTFDRVVANPPFTRGADIAHIREMYRVCKPGGIVSTISSPSWVLKSDRKSKEFREWLEELNAYTYEFEGGEFSDTKIAVVMITIRKP